MVMGRQRLWAEGARNLNAGGTGVWVLPYLSSAPQKEERYKRHRQKQKHKDKWKHPERPDAKDPASLPQCLGPGCVRPAQPGSKYCSDDCGMKLAAK